MTQPPLCTDPQLVAFDRELDRLLCPVVDAALANLGLTRDDLPRLIAEHQARQRAALVARTGKAEADPTPRQRCGASLCAVC